MNLLVTNTGTCQAYAVIRALRPRAHKIVATAEGNTRLSTWRCHAAFSRFVDRRYFVRSPVEDWWSGGVQVGNTEREEAFVQTLLRICRDERIDVIFPSWDPYVYVLSKNKARFDKEGVLIPVPDFGTAITPLDKYRTVVAAREVGFPCPHTYVYETERELEKIAVEEGFPLVVKPRFTSGGRGMVIARDARELVDGARRTRQSHGSPMIQEYIPGGKRESVQFVMDRSGEVKFTFHKKRHRKFRVTARYGTVSESAAPPAYAPQAAKLLKRVGWWGAAGVETILDPRDGAHKIMEINPRFPRQLWNRTELGIDEPGLCLRIGRGEAVETLEGCPEGIVFLSPLEDLQLLGLQLIDLALYRFRTGILRRQPIDPSDAPMPLRKRLPEFSSVYRSKKRKVIDPYLRHFAEDPLTSLLWWLEFAGWMVGARKILGR